MNHGIINSLSDNNDILSSHCNIPRTAQLQQPWPHGMTSVPVSTMSVTTDATTSDYQFLASQAGKFKYG